MLHRFVCPAAQLQSVALRYRWKGPPGGDREGAVAIRRRWLAGSARNPSRAVQAAPNGRDHRLQRLEAVLYLAREPLTTRKLSQYANLADGTEARTLIRRLNELYDRSARAFRAERVAGGYQLMTRPQFATWVRRLEHAPQETRLSAPALETLAVIAYRQPVLRAAIEAIRGVNCGEILRQLMERDLVRISGRSEELGRPYYYATSKRFLALFGLESLDQLPRGTQLKPSADTNLSGPGSQEGLHESQNPVEIKATDEAAFMEEDSKMPILSVSGAGLELVAAGCEDDLLKRPIVEAFDDEEDEAEGDADADAGEEGDDEDFEDDEDLDEDLDDDFDEEEEFDSDEDFDDEEWEEVGDEDADEEEEEEEEEEDWEEEEEEDWDYDEEEEEEEEEEGEDWE
jgi:segregation and condensation protein B